MTVYTPHLLFVPGAEQLILPDTVNAVIIDDAGDFKLCLIHTNIIDQYGVYWKTVAGSEDVYIPLNFDRPSDDGEAESEGATAEVGNN
jgi:hypothetical protein